MFMQTTGLEASFQSSFDVLLRLRQELLAAIALAFERPMCSL